jgi:hypothetical protein
MSVQYSSHETNKGLWRLPHTRARSRFVLFRVIYRMTCDDVRSRRVLNGSLILTLFYWVIKYHT